MQKNKQRPVLDFNAVYWLKDEVLYYMRWAPATLSRKIRSKDFPPALHEEPPTTWIDKHGRRIAPRRPTGKARWLRTDVIAWAEANLGPRSS